MPDEPIETVVEEQEEPVVEVETDDEPPAEDGMSEAETKEAQNLYKLLKDPSSNKAVLRVLAEQAGISFETPKTVTEEKQVKKDFKKILEDKLGPDLKWLVPKLGDALEEMFDQERTENEVKLSSFTEKETINEVVRVSEKLNRETKGEYKKLEPRMNQLASKILPAPGVSVEEYCRNLYAIASGEKGRSVEKNKIADRINRNANNASERVRPTSAGGERSGQPPAKLTLRQAVALAAEQQNKGK